MGVQVPPFAFRALASLVARGGFGRVLVLAMAAGAIYLAAVPIARPVARSMMAKVHLRGPFASWAIGQTVPSMYSFANVVTIDVPDDPAGRFTVWLNHYPLRAITFLRRADLATGPRVVRAESRYGVLRMVTECRTQPVGGIIEVQCRAVE